MQLLLALQLAVGGYYFWHSRATARFTDKDTKLFWPQTPRLVLEQIGIPIVGGLADFTYSALRLILQLRDMDLVCVP